MRHLNANEIREIWRRFFEERVHRIEESAGLVPVNDPTLLFINAGIAPLKGYFDGTRVPKNPRLANIQKCIRTSDIEEVGKTARHHTFFEMLGNFSIGDYFRDEAIEWAYEILTDKKYYGMDSERLYVTIYLTDEETKEKWKEIGIAAERIIATEANFWEIGEGPSGPCTEIFYDRGDDFGEHDLDLLRKDIDNDRFVEIWNIVFSQFNAKEGIPREEYPELPNKNIDTGMGLERMAAILQGAKTNFETDLFLPLIESIAEKSGVPYKGQKSHKIIADHIRSVVFAVGDGATFGNEGRGYVLRRLLRRAIKHGRQLGIEGPFLVALAQKVVAMMKEAYPNLEKSSEFIEKMVLKEEEQFLETLKDGENILKEIMQKGDGIISGADAFKLYDTYGFPLELTEEYAEAEGLTVDGEGFKEHMAMQKERARKAREKTTSMAMQNAEFLAFKAESEFIGYRTLSAESEIVKAFNEGVVTAKTPFYAESGGQLADQGTITRNGMTFAVEDVQRLPNGQHYHIIGEHDLKEGDTVHLQVDEHARRRTMAHHSATHLLYSGLRRLLGEHIGQHGSLVGPDYLRFDFNHHEFPADETLLALERHVNEKIAEDIEVAFEEGTIDEAQERGAIAEFGEKYEDTVRMVNMGETLDLCGGTHVERTAEIGSVAIVSIESKGSGIYRIIALAGERVDAAEEFLGGFLENLRHLENKAASILEEARSEGIELTFDKGGEFQFEGSYNDVIRLRKRLSKMQRNVRALEKEFEEKRKQRRLADLDEYLEQKDEQGNLVLKTEGMDTETLKSLADRLMENLQEGVVFLANRRDDKLVFICKSLGSVHAGNLVREAAKIAGGGGGGRPDFAQAGAKDVEKLDETLRFVKEKLREDPGA